MTSPEQDVQAKNGKPAGSGLSDSDPGVTGAAAAVAATAPAKERAPAEPPAVPVTQEPAPQPVRAASAIQTPPPAAGGALPEQPNASGNRSNANGLPDGVAPLPATATPVQAAASPPAPAAASTPAAPARARSGGEVDDTQVSFDARPEPPQAPPAPPRVPQRPPAPVRRTTRVRKARLRLTRLDPWSVMKTAFLLSVAVGITLFIAVAVLWSVLDTVGVFTSVGDLVSELTQSETSAGVQIEEYVALPRVLGVTTLIAVVDVVLLTALATLGAFLYNLSASLVGGLEVTLAEDD